MLQLAWHFDSADNVIHSLINFGTYLNVSVKPSTEKFFEIYVVVYLFWGLYSPI